MKTIIIVSLLITTVSVSAQKSSFTKTLSKDQKEYYISDTVTVENGKDEKVKKFFSLSVDTSVWTNFVKKHEGEQSAFDFIANMLTINVKYKLKNRLSFEPIDGNFITWYDKDNSYITNYKLMARNGYGNLTEGEIFVEYKPE